MNDYATLPPCHAARLALCDLSIAFARTPEAKEAALNTRTAVMARVFDQLVMPQMVCQHAYASGLPPHDSWLRFRGSHSVAALSVEGFTIDPQRLLLCEPVLAELLRERF